MQTLIILGGLPPSPELTRQTFARADQVIAADSGYHPLRDCGLAPDLLVGDFDSLLDHPENCPFEVIHAPEHTATDFEKALRYLPGNTDELIILGGTGLRSDHFLTNLLIAASISPNFIVRFLDDLQSIQRGTPECPVRGHIREGSIVSIIPFTSCKGVSTEGLHWNLQNSPMSAKRQLSQSNIADNNDVTITLKEGVLYFIVNL